MLEEGIDQVSDNPALTNKSRRGGGRGGMRDCGVLRADSILNG